MSIQHVHTQHKTLHVTCMFWTCYSNYDNRPTSKQPICKPNWMGAKLHPSLTMSVYQERDMQCIQLALHVHMYITCFLTRHSLCTLHVQHLSREHMYTHRGSGWLWHILYQPGRMLLYMYCSIPCFGQLNVLLFEWTVRIRYLLRLFRYNYIAIPHLELIDHLR